MKRLTGNDGCYIGIDPGKGGAIAVIKNGKVIATTTMILTTKKKIDLSSMTEWIVEATNGMMPLACIESVGAMPGQGVSSMFSFGYSVGALHGILAALGIPRHVVSPRKWQKAVLGRYAKTKDITIEFVCGAYPGISLLATERSKKPHSGIADAICIARYAYMNL